MEVNEAYYRSKRGDLYTAVERLRSQLLTGTNCKEKKSL